jgi:hypothetical protein
MREGSKPKKKAGRLKNVLPLALEGIQWRRTAAANSYQALLRQCMFPWISATSPDQKKMFQLDSARVHGRYRMDYNIWDLLQEDQFYIAPKYGLCKVNHSAGVRLQRELMLHRNGCALRLCLENVAVVAVAIVISSQANILTHILKPFSGLSIMELLTYL